jgi:TolA-binding protein
LQRSSSGQKFASTHAVRTNPSSNSISRQQSQQLQQLQQIQQLREQEQHAALQQQLQQQQQQRAFQHSLHHRVQGSDRSDAIASDAGSEASQTLESDFESSTDQHSPQPHAYGGHDSDLPSDSELDTRGRGLSYGYNAALASQLGGRSGLVKSALPGYRPSVPRVEIEQDEESGADVEFTDDE